jgi:hypothetical protein
VSDDLVVVDEHDAERPILAPASPRHEANRTAGSGAM